MAHQNDDRLSELVHQLAHLRIKLEELQGKPIDDKRGLLVDYISLRLQQITDAILKPSKTLIPLCALFDAARLLY